MHHYHAQVKTHSSNSGVCVCACVQDSLAAEIEGTMRRELSVEEECAFQDQRSETCSLITPKSKAHAYQDFWNVSGSAVKQAADL